MITNDWPGGFIFEENVVVAFQRDEVAVWVFGCQSGLSPTAWTAVVSFMLLHYSDDVDQGVVGLMCGRKTGSILYDSEHTAVAMNDNLGYSMRVMPMIGEGSVRNVEDVLCLRRVDLSLVYTDKLTFIERQGVHPYIKERIAYITAMHSAKLHLIARNGIASVGDLAGKKVNFSMPGTGSLLIMSNIVSSLDLEVDVQTDPEAVPLDRLKRSEIAAMTLNTALPWKLTRDVVENDGLKQSYSTCLRNALTDPMSRSHGPMISTLA